MNTKILMSISAIIMGLFGIALIFLPQEIATLLEMTPGLNEILFQVLGALYFGFSMVNWTARGSLIGGIYGRPIALGNFTHFLIGGLSLAKIVFEMGNQVSIVVLTVIYTLFAIAFGYVFFTHPVKKSI